jgi:hypothetical protein
VDDLRTQLEKQKQRYWKKVHELEAIISKQDHDMGVLKQNMKAFMMRAESAERILESVIELSVHWRDYASKAPFPLEPWRTDESD